MSSVVDGLNHWTYINPTLKQPASIMCTSHGPNEHGYLRLFLLQIIPCSLPPKTALARVWVLETAVSIHPDPAMKTIEGQVHFYRPNNRPTGWLAGRPVGARAGSHEICY